MSKARSRALPWIRPGRRRVRNERAEMQVLGLVLSHSCGTVWTQRGVCPGVTKVHHPPQHLPSKSSGLSSFLGRRSHHLVPGFKLGFPPTCRGTCQPGPLLMILSECIQLCIYIYMYILYIYTHTVVYIVYNEICIDCLCTCMMHIIY